MPLTLEILTPEGRVYNDTIDAIVIPTTSGEVGILPGHIPLVTQVAVGELKIRKGAETVRLIIGDGFASIENDEVSVLAEHAINEAKIDTQSAEEAIKAAQLTLEKNKNIDAAEVERIERLLLFMQAQIGKKRKR